jgi:hypothetical protein
MAIDTDKLQEFLGRFVTDLGATFAAGNVVTGHHLGLYRALAAGPADRSPGHVDKTAIVPLERHGHGHGRAIPVLSHNQVSLTGPW